MGQPQRHLFVCCNQRPADGKPSCGARGGERLLERFTEALAARPELWAEVAATPCGCLGPCFDGPTLVVYPDAIFYARVGEGDVAEIVQRHLIEGIPVERLVYRWP
jgi:(2Fe-2S) ferredoxin